jgi:SAM-dependent methyltransferase
MTTADAEREKYTRMWARPEYRQWSPGEDSAERALEAFGPPPALIYDFGCGQGLTVDRFHREGFLAIGWDIVPLGPAVIEACLWDLPHAFMRADYSFCADVMEHLPEDRVHAALAGIARLTQRRAFFRISTRPDSLGPLIGEVLHLTVRPGWWWKVALARHFEVASEKLYQDFTEIIVDVRGGARADAQPERRADARKG